MRAFAALLESLYFEPSISGKERLLVSYLKSTPDPDRGIAIAVITNALTLPNFKRSMILDLVRERTDPVLFALSYDYVGELSETVAHLWPTAVTAPAPELPPLHAVVDSLRLTPKAELPHLVAGLLDRMTSPERWALLKIGTGSLRIGVSARLMKQVLARYGGVDVEAVETVWHTLAPPYLDLFDWLEGRVGPPAVGEKLAFTPVMLAHPLDARDHAQITPETYAAEWKFDGIRVEAVHGKAGLALYTRSGDDISASFPDLLMHLNFQATLDGELVVLRDGVQGSFNDLQQRLGRKKPSAKMMTEYPAGLIAYDILSLEGEDVRGETYASRRTMLATALDRFRPRNILLSPELPFADFAELTALRDSAADRPAIEGLMLKRRDSVYVSGRPTGPWYKWKIDPKLVDAVLMYAQRGSGKRSSFYSDFTFGLWQDGQLLPVGKSYFGFTDAELLELDRWVRHHTLQQFGPVREVEKTLVFEVAFDAVQRSKRHKSGFALRFPRINRIRWDKPAAEADRLTALEGLL